MISLERQFQSIVLSIAFGMFFMFSYSLFDRLFKNTKVYLRLPFELTLFLSLTYLFFILNVYVNEGIIHIYIPLFIFMGIIIYHKFYSKYILRSFENVLNFIDKKILDKIKLELKKIYDIIKRKKRVKRNAKKQQSRSRSLESKQSGQYSYDWSFFNCDYGNDQDSC